MLARSVGRRFLGRELAHKKGETFVTTHTGVCVCGRGGGGCVGHSYLVLWGDLEW